METEESAASVQKPSRNSQCRPARICIYVLLVCTIFLAMLCIAFFVLFRFRNEARSIDRCHNLCATRQCIKSASYSLSRIDLSENPCKDFYQFACGTFGKEIQLLPEHKMGFFNWMETDSNTYLDLKGILDSINTKASDDEPGLALRKVKKFYDYCMDSRMSEEESILSIQRILSDEGVGKWPLLDPGLRTLNLERRLSKLAMYRVHVFMKTSVYKKEPSSGSESFLEIELSSADHSVEKSLFKDTSADAEGLTLMDKYRRVLYTLLKVLGVPQTSTKEAIDEMVAFQDRLIKAIENSSAIMDTIDALSGEEIHNDKEFSCEALERHLPSIRWCRLIRFIFEEMNAPPQVNSTIRLIGIEYFHALEGILNTTSQRVIANYLSLQFVLRHLQFLNHPLRQLYYSNDGFFLKTMPYRLIVTKWQQCVDQTALQFYAPLLKPFLDKHFNDTMQKEAHDLIQEISEVMNSFVGQISWLNDEFRIYIFRQLRDIKVNLAAIKYLPSEEVFDNFFRRLNLRGDSFLEIAMEVNRFKMIAITFGAEIYKRLGTLFMETGFGMKAAMTDQLLSLENRNLLLGIFASLVSLPKDIELGNFRFPGFAQDRPRYMDYAGVGSVIAHEISHAVTALIHNKDHLASEAAKMKYSNISKCVKEHYSNLIIDRIKVNVDGETTYLENIADVLGVYGSLQAYKKYLKKYGEERRLPGLPFTNEQSFFLYYAQNWCEVRTLKGYNMYRNDTHSPARHRVNGPLAHSTEFAEAFRCPVGSQMNPVKKCSFLN